MILNQWILLGNLWEHIESTKATPEQEYTENALLNEMRAIPRIKSFELKEYNEDGPSSSSSNNGNNNYATSQVVVSSKITNFVVSNAIIRF